MQSKFLKKYKLPDKPGVYFFLKGKQILYIGKATSLRDRTKSYFSKDLINTRGPLILDMAFKADKIKWEVSDSVLEALILEANLIKKHQPYYNTREKDDKSFNYVCITKPARTTGVVQSGGEKIPKVIIVRGKNLVESSYANTFGPFTNGSQLREALKIIRPIFPYLDEKSKNYYQFYKQVNLVPDLTTPEGIKQYKKNIKNLKLFFEGKKKKVLRNLEKEMKQYAKTHAFEKAGEVKRQIFALKHINDVALLKQDSTFSNGLAGVGDPGNRGPEKKKNLVQVLRIEAYDIAHMSGKNMVGVMTVVEDGQVAKHEYKKFKIRTQAGTNDTGALAEVLSRRLLHREWQYPNLIVVDGSTAQINVARYALMKERAEIPVVAVVKDERHKAREILGDTEYGIKYKKQILLANSEAHRFAIAYHKLRRGKSFLL